MTTLTIRIRNKLVSYPDRWLSRLYNARHPGTVGRRILAAAAPVTAACQPNDKWNLHILAPRWFRVLKCPPLHPLPAPKSIFVFCTYRGVFTTHLVLSAILAWRGHKVTIGYLPKLQSPSKPPLVDHPSASGYIHSVMDRLTDWTGGAITAIDLTSNLTPATIDHTAVEQQARYDTVMAYQKEGLDLDDPKVRALYNHMVAAGAQAQTALRNHFAEHRYDMAIVGNGTTYEGSHACRILKELEHPLNTTEKFAFRGVRVINHGDHFLGGGDIGHIWNQRAALGYTDEPYLSRFVEKAHASILERSRNSTETWLWELQHAVDQSEEDALRNAGVPPDTPFVLVLPNVVFDAGYGKITNLFPSMKAWLFETVKFLLENSDHLIVVRAHPGEGLWWGGREPVHALLAEHGIEASERLVIIPGQAHVNTYRLMERCLFGAVFSSSTGLEMAVMGKHVFTASDVIYANRGFTHDAGNVDEYFKNLGKFARRVEIQPRGPDIRQQAALFYFVYHWVAQYPYPYDKPSGIARRSPAALVQADDMRRFLPYFDLLSLNEDEFRDQIDRYLSADQVLARLDATN